MDNGQNISNELVRDGLSQAQRNKSTPSTGDENVMLDKRTASDMLDFIYRYARYVLYYDDQVSDDNTLFPSGDWQNFFNGNLPFRYATIHKFPVGGFQDRYLEIRNRPVLQTAEVSLLINRILDIAIQLNTWYKALDKTDSQAGLFLMLDTLITTDLYKALYRLVEIANTVHVTEYDISVLINNHAWALTLDKLVAEDKSLKRFDAYPRRKMQAIVTALDEVFGLFYKGIQEVQQFAGDHFNDILNGAQEDAAHLGLLYAFLKLFEQVNKSLNQVAGRHLDFFYKEILQLKQNEFIPDHVHVVIELAKQTSEFLLQKDTALNAGKVNNKNLDFLPENDIVVNKAAVASLRTLFKDEKGIIYIAPVADSADGIGSAFRDPTHNSWPLLGTREFDDKNNPAPDQDHKKHHPFAATGLIISSSVLLLKEGERTINIQITLDREISALKPAIETPLYILNETNLKLLENAGLAKIFVSLLPSPQEPGWSVLLQEADWKKLQIDGDVLDSARKITETFLLETAYTSDTGWVPFIKPDFKVGEPAPDIISIAFTLPIGAPAVLVPDPRQLLVDYGVDNPLIRLSFNHQARYHLNDNVTYYQILSNCIIQAINIDVTVNNAKELLLANDEGPVDGKKSFFPFTSVPKIGSNFYIGSDEAFRKKLSLFEVNVTWDGLPDSLDDYYKGYLLPAGVSINDTRVDEQTLVNGRWQLKSGNVILFTDFSLKTSTYNIPDIVSANQPHINQEVPLTPYNNSTVNGYIRLRLKGHFYHLQYPSILAKKLLGVKDEMNRLIDNTPAPQGIVQQSASLKTSATDTDNYADKLVAHTEADLSVMAGKTETTKNESEALDTDILKLRNFVLPDKPGPVSLPLPPYTPAIKEISFSYKANAGNEDITLLHRYPFEESNYKLLRTKDQANFMPLFNDEGTLYFSLEEATPGSNVSLLFQLAEFTANPDIEEAVIAWYYLSGNEWKILQPVKDVISDTTLGFQVSGIVTIALPWEADPVHTILPSGQYWLKASAIKNSDAVCEAITVAAQGVKAVFFNQENDLTRLAAPLPPGSITAPRIPRTEIKKISQDFPSFGGSLPEDQNHFYLRVSERLRHKGRAISVYDYEHIVLEAFPSVFKVKCIPHTKMCLATAEGELLSSPGWVTLAVIPEIKNYPAESRFQPKVSRIVLKNIKDFVSTKTSAFVQVQVLNPRYQTVDFKGKIFLKKGKDVPFYKGRLQQDVRNFLSPWILTDSDDIVFGGTLMMSSVLGFIEKLDYVEYVTDFQMLDLNAVPVKGITATMPWAVITSGKQDYKVATADN